MVRNVDDLVDMNELILRQHNTFLGDYRLMKTQLS